MYELRDPTLEEALGKTDATINSSVSVASDGKNGLYLMTALLILVISIVTYLLTIKMNYPLIA